MQVDGLNVLVRNPFVERLGMRTIDWLKAGRHGRGDRGQMVTEGAERSSLLVSCIRKA